MPDGRDFVDAENSYNDWKNTYVTSDGAGGFRRVLFDDLSSTVSEGIGYGMLLSANYDDKALLDDLWGYYNLHLDENGLMHWKIDENGNVIGFNAATDADEDVAIALVLADRQWGSQGSVNYLQEAIDLVNLIFQYEVESITYVLKPGDVWGGSDTTNPSYFAPSYYRVFKLITGNPEWDQVINKCYEILQNAVNSTTGLVPDWCKADGTPVSGYSHDYTYDAVRTPWRIALDYVWFGNQEANSFCTTMTGFANGIGTHNIVDGYKLDGTPIGKWHNSAFVGTFAVGSMGTDPTYQSYCNESYSDNVSTNGDSYFNMTLRTLTLFLQTGNFFNPDTAFVAVIEGDSIQEPYYYSLQQNYPNPFNFTTTITYQIATSDLVTLRVYDNVGREVRTLVDQYQSVGNKFITWDGTNDFGQRVASGTYMYRLQADGSVQNRIMLLLK